MIDRLKMNWNNYVKKNENRSWKCKQIRATLENNPLRNLRVHEMIIT